MQPWVEPDRGPTPVAARVAGPRVGVLRPARPVERHDLRPLATFEIVDQAASFWRRRLGVVVGVTFAATVPVALAAALSCGAGLACTGASPTWWAAAFGDSRNDPLVVLALVLAAGLAAQIASAAIAHLVAAERLGNELGGRAALRLALRRTWAVTAAWVVGRLIYVFSALSVVGPLVVLPFALCTTPAIAIEQLGPLAGVRRSWRLGRTRFWPLLGVALSSGLVATLLGLAFGLLPLLLEQIGPLERWSWALRAAGAQLQVVVSVPLTAVATTLAYLDVRVRIEGLDLQIDADRAFVAP